MIQPKIISVVLALLLSLQNTGAAYGASSKNTQGDYVVTAQSLGYNSTKNYVVLDIGPNITESIDSDMIGDAHEHKHTDRIEAKTPASSSQESKHPQSEHINLKDLGDFKVTAYCGCEKCNGKWAGQTASGLKPTQGITVAVDKSIIPLGTKIYIEGVGEFIAQDTGVKGKSIDIYMNSHQAALNWGVKNLDVKIGY